MPGRLSIVMLPVMGAAFATALILYAPEPIRALWRSGNVSDLDRQVAGKQDKEGEKSQVIQITDDDRAIAQIDTIEVGRGTLTRRIIVPGSIVPHADRLARVSVKLPSIVAELRKRIGDSVSKDEVIAVLESREVADAKSEYLAARLTDELQQELFERDKALWDKRISSEQQFLRSRNAAAQTKMRLDTARQKLIALGLEEKEIGALPAQPESSLRRQDVRAPISGRVVERKVDLGTALGRDNLETELFVILNLERVWIELAVNADDLSTVKEGQKVEVSGRGIADKGQAQIIFISPLLDKDTRSARVVAEIPNPAGIWRPGSFVTAAITIEEQQADTAVPLSALQTIGTERVVFVRTAGGFEKRAITVGNSDTRMAEVTSGLRPGEIIARSNTFALKAELLKSSVED